MCLPLKNTSMRVFQPFFPSGFDSQLWRLEHMDKCLELEQHIDGALVVFKPETGLDIQKWIFENNFIDNKVHYFY